MGRDTCHAVVHEVAKSWKLLSHWTELKLWNQFKEEKTKIKISPIHPSKYRKAIKGHENKNKNILKPAVINSDFFSENKTIFYPEIYYKYSLFFITTNCIRKPPQYITTKTFGEILKKWLSKLTTEEDFLDFNLDT